MLYVFLQSISVSYHLESIFFYWIPPGRVASNISPPLPPISNRYFSTRPPRWTARLTSGAAQAAHYSLGRLSIDSLVPGGFLYKSRCSVEGIPSAQYYLIRGFYSSVEGARSGKRVCFALLSTAPSARRASRRGPPESSTASK